MVGVRVAGHGPFLALRASDLGEGGMFVVCEPAPEPLTEVELRLRTSDGALLALRAHVAHVVTSQTAPQRRKLPGMGLEFQALDDRQRQELARIIEEARKDDPRRRVPHRCPAADEAAPADAMLSYLLRAIDGERAPEELAESCLLEIDVVLEMLDVLYQQGLIVFRGANGTRTTLGGPDVDRIADREASQALSAHAACDLDAERCAAIDAQLAHLERAQGDHYAVLGVDPAASPEAIRAAFSALSARFHADTYRGTQLGAYRAHLARIHDELCHAYAVLGRKERRREHDAYLARVRRAGELEQRAASARQSMPAAAPAPHDAAKARLALRRSVIERLERALPPRPRASRPEAPATPKVTGKPVLAQTARTEPTAASNPNRSQIRPRSVATRLLDGAEEGIARGDRISAVRQLDLVTRVEHATWEPRHQQRYDRLLVSLADTIELMARYEERHQHWSKAASSWTRLSQVRPNDPECARRAASALLQAKGDLRAAVELAERAVRLGPDDHRNHEALGHALIAAKLSLRAERVLTHAAQLRARFDMSSPARPAPAPMHLHVRRRTA